MSRRVEFPRKPQALFYQTAAKRPTVERAEGIWLYDSEGKRYLDGSSGAVVANIGHGNPRVIEAMRRQASQVSFAYRTQFENKPATELADRLTRRLSQGLNRVFFVSGGSEAVEAAIKLARQYHVARGDARRYRVISRFPSFHGATLGALSATGYLPLTQPYEPLLVGPNHIPAPICYRCPIGLSYPSCAVACASELERAIEALGADTIAAFLLEPVGGASSGAAVPPPEYLGIVSRIARRHGILLIYDEVMTGVGRTGAFCAYQHWESEAEVDILALSKGFGAGYAPLGAIVARDGIVDTVLAQGGFPHGHTYAGNPLACAVGLAVLDELEARDLIANARERGAQLKARLAELMDKRHIIGDVRGLGLLLGVEFVRDLATREPFPADWRVHELVTEAAFEVGLIVYPRRSIGGVEGDHVLIAPPLIITADEVDELADLFDRALALCEARLAEIS